MQRQGENFAHRQHLKLPHSRCRVCQLKSYISKAIQPIFENFASARRCWGWEFRCKVSDAQLFSFCNGKVKTLRIDNIWIFPLWTCRVCQLKSYISKAIQPIFENVASARRCWGWAFGWKVSGAQFFYFCNGKVKTLRIDNIWNLPLSTCRECQLKSYRPIYTTHNFWYGTDKIGTDETWTIYLGSPNFIRTNFIRTKPKIEHSVNA